MELYHLLPLPIYVRRDRYIFWIRDSEIQLSHSCSNQQICLQVFNTNKNLHLKTFLQKHPSVLSPVLKYLLLKEAKHSLAWKASVKLLATKSAKLEMKDNIDTEVHNQRRFLLQGKPILILQKEQSRRLLSINEWLFMCGSRFSKQVCLVLLYEVSDLVQI